MASKIEKVIRIPEHVQAHLDKSTLKIKGPKGEVNRQFRHPSVNLAITSGSISVSTESTSRKEKKIMNSFVAHIRNLLKGVVEGFQYDLKICSGHFPMTVAVDGNQVLIKNFLGEKIPRKAKIVHGTKVEIKGNDIFVSGVNKEHVGETAANLEQSTRITNRDRRVFMDGLWITSKAGKKA